jgi:hypothetical protein
MELKAFDLLKICEFCRLANEKEVPSQDYGQRPAIIGKQWYADI